MSPTEARMLSEDRGAPSVLVGKLAGASRPARKGDAGRIEIAVVADKKMLQAIRNGSWWMRRDMRKWLGPALDAGLIRHRRPCEANDWTRDFVLTKLGESHLER